MRRFPQGFAVLVPVLAVGLAFGVGAKRMQAQTGAPANSLPDILGARTGMAPGDAYNLLKEHDPAHSVALEQLTYPQLYGDKPITTGMNTTTGGNDDQFSVEITLPPNAQFVWRVHRVLGRFSSTTPNVINSLLQKYGTPWNPNAPAPPDPHEGILRWFYDEQGHRMDQAVAPLVLKNCMNSTLNSWFGDDAPRINGRTSTTMERSITRTATVTMPPLMDPSKNPQCTNLVVLEVRVNGGGIVNTGDLSFTLEFTMTDYTAQHRAEVALDNALNAIILHGAQQQRNAAGQQAVPKF
jgi:hypothetical protein